MRKFLFIIVFFVTVFEIKGQDIVVYNQINTLLEKANVYDKKNQIDSSISCRLQVIELCKREHIDDVLPIIEYTVACNYHRYKDIKNLTLSIFHFKEAFQGLKSKTDKNSIDFALGSIESIVSLYGMLNMQDSIICFINENNSYLKKHTKDYTEDVFKILYWKVSSYINLDFNKPEYRKDAIKIQKELIKYEYETHGENSINYLNALYVYTFCLTVHENKKELTDIYSKAFSIWKKIPNKETHSEYYSYVNNYLTFLYKSDSKDSLLIARLEDEMYRFCNFPNTSLSTKINFYTVQAQLQMNRCDYKKADSLSSKIISLIQEVGKDDQLVLYKLSRAYIYKAEIKLYNGDLSSADSLAYIAQTTIEHLGNKNESYAKILLLRSMIKSQIGDYNSAINLGMEGIMTQYHCDPEKIDPYDLCHILEISHGHTKVFLFSEFSKMFKGTRIYNVFEGRLMIFLAEGYSEIGDYDKANSIYERAYKLLQKSHYNQLFQNGDRWNDAISILYSSWGKNLLCQKKVPEGISYLEKDNNPGKYLLVKMYAYNNDIEKFERTAMDNFEWVKDDIAKHFLFLGDHEREMYMQSMDYHLMETESFAALLPNNNFSLKLAFNAILLHKGMALNSYVTTKKKLSHILEIQDNIKTLKTLKINYINANNIETRQILSAKISDEEKQVQRYISENSSFLNDIFVSWNQVKNALKENEVVVEFFMFYKNNWPWVQEGDMELWYGALVLKKDYETPMFVEIAQDDFIRSLVSSNYYFSDSTCLVIWGQLNSSFSNNEIVYFSPIGQMCAINLEAVGNQLYSNHFIRISSSRDIIFRNDEKRDKSHAVLYGGIDYAANTQLSNADTSHNNISTKVICSSSIRGGELLSLPETQKEIDTILSILPSNIEVICFSKEDATEESFKALSEKQVSILHIATHGFSTGNNSVKDFNEPMRQCGMLFAGAQDAWNGINSFSNREDGIVLGEEIAELNLIDNDIVVLSACNSALGKLSSEGVWGLQRAFKKAGANSILMSLWEADDFSTRLFMTEFYKHYLSGKSKQESLKLAQKHVREYKDDNGNHLFESPFYWASWILLDAID